MRVRPLLSMAMIIAYPLLAHLSALLHRPELGCVAVWVLLTLLFSGALWKGQKIAWALWLVLCGATLWLMQRGQIRLPQFVAPLLIDAFVAWLFGHTLRQGHEPLIARIIAIMDGPHVLEDPMVRVYARRLTWLWAVLMCALASTAFLLALFEQPDGILLALGIKTSIAVSAEQWSWFANFLNYALVGVCLAVEMVCRPYLLPQAPPRRSREFALRMLTLWPELLRDATLPRAKE